MSLIDDIGNVLSNVAGAVGNAMTTTVNAFTDTLVGPFHRLFR
jgi:phage-related protein